MKTLQKKPQSVLLTYLFLIAALAFPLYVSNVGTTFSPDYILTHYFAIRIIGSACYEGDVDWKKKNILAWIIGLLLVGFNVITLYGNITYHNWYMGQINMTIAFLFFIMLLQTKETAAINNESVVRFVLYATMIIMAVSLIPGPLGIMQVEVSLTNINFIPKLWWNHSYGWVYSHKSEYAFILILCIAMSIVYRRMYTKRWHFLLSLAIFVIGLVLSNTRVTMMAALFVFAGALLDFLAKKAGGFRWKQLLLLIPFLLAGIALLAYFSKTRNLFSLGGRTYIWRTAISRILDNPWGNGAMLGSQMFPVPTSPEEGWHHDVGNWHNVFLNAMAHFSLLSGALCVLKAASIAVFAFMKNLSFFALGTLAAMLVALNMDWCLLIGQVPLVLMFVYFIFFHPLRKTESGKE